MVFLPALLNVATQKYLLQEQHRASWPPFLFSAAASALDRCTVVLMLWHFHKEMDVVGSIRQQSDIYIRKNGCCWPKGKVRRWERSSSMVFSPHPHWCSLTVILPLLQWNRDGTWNIFLPPSAVPAGRESKVLTYVSALQPTSEGG